MRAPTKIKFTLPKNITLQMIFLQKQFNTTKKYPLNANQIETKKKQICCRTNSHIESPKYTYENVPIFSKKSFKNVLKMSEDGLKIRLCIHVEGRIWYKKYLVGQVFPS